eukprot:6351341-Pyramimonas_sp.AAC.1
MLRVLLVGGLRGAFGHQGYLHHAGHGHDWVPASDGCDSYPRQYERHVSTGKNPLHVQGTFKEHSRNIPCAGIKVILVVIGDMLLAVAHATHLGHRLKNRRFPPGHEIGWHGTPTILKLSSVVNGVLNLAVIHPDQPSAREYHFWHQRCRGRGDDKGD